LEAQDFIMDKGIWMVQHKGVVLTKDNLAKWNWYGNKKCVFLSSGLLGSTPYPRVLYKKSKSVRQRKSTAPPPLHRPAKVCRRP
jgi:hypothetical protein